MGGCSPAGFGEPDPLVALASLAVEAGAAQLAAEATALAARAAEGRFYVACVGQFKRGKSTLINALVDEAVLPTGVVPVTALVTVLRQGLRSARVHLRRGETRDIGLDAVAEYVTEKQNPQNRQGAELVEVFLPSSLLSGGMCLVDTPGIGSVFAGNTETTRAFIPHIDAALLVLGGDPPITADELALVKVVARAAPAMLFVLNKADRLTEAERQEASAFTARVLEDRLGRPIGPLYQVSAAERLTGGPPTRDWVALEAALAKLATEAGGQLIAAAQRRGLDRLRARLLHDVDEQRGALVRPLGESLQRVELLRRCVLEAQRSLRELGPLLAAEQESLARSFALERDAFLIEAIPAAKGELERVVDVPSGSEGVPSRRRAISQAQEIAERRVRAWLDQVEPVAAERYRRAIERFTALISGLMTRMAEAGVPELAAPPTDLPQEAGLRSRRRFFFTDLWTIADAPIHARLLDRLRSREAAARSVARGTVAYLERLLTSNSARVANDLTERVLDSRRRVEAEILAHLRAVVTSAEHAVLRARAQREAGESTVQAEVERLTLLRARIEAIGRSQSPNS